MQAAEMLDSEQARRLMTAQPPWRDQSGGDLCHGTKWHICILRETGAYRSRVRDRRSRRALHRRPIRFRLARGDAHDVEIVDYRNGRAPMVPIHPGGILKRELAERGMSANRLALALRVPSGASRRS